MIALYAPLLSMQAPCSASAVSATRRYHDLVYGGGNCRMVASQDRTRDQPQECVDLAIETAGFIRQAFRLPLCQAEGFMTSLARIMKAGIATTTPSRTAPSDYSLSARWYLFPETYYSPVKDASSCKGRRPCSLVSTSINASRSTCPKPCRSSRSAACIAACADRASFMALFDSVR